MGMLILGLLLGAVCVDSHGFHCDRSVAATIKASEENRLKISVAVGEVVALELPKDVEMRGEPALGNAALFDVKVVSKPLRVLVWPRLPSNTASAGPGALLGVRSNLQLFLDSGITLLIELRIARSGRAVQRVQFDFPERKAEAEYVRERVAKEVRRLEEEYRAREAEARRNLDSLAKERSATGMLAHAECEALRERSMRDLIVFRAHRICRIGQDLFVVFSVHNRSRKAFSVETVEVRPEDSEGDGLSSVVTYEGGRYLSFDQRVRGVVAWTVEADEPVPSAWDLITRESGSRGRAVALGGIGF